MKDRKELQTVIESLRKLPSVLAIQESEPDYYNVVIDCGRLPSGIEYSGLWGSGTTAGNELTVSFSIGDLYGDGEYYTVEPLTARVLTNSVGLPYTSTLEDTVSELLSAATNGLFSCAGSEQGMQDYDEYDNGTVMHYYSADVELELDSVAA